MLSALVLAGCATVPEPVTPPAVSPHLAGMQYLYGSGEAAAISRQSWTSLVEFVAMRLARREVDSVILDEGGSLDSPRFLPCGDKPKAAVFDVDETVLLNLGFEHDDLIGPAGRPFDPRWTEWEAKGADAVDETPGARAALSRLRALGVTVVFNTNRKDAVGTAAALDAAGLGPAVHKDTLYVQGDDDAGESKDVRRRSIAARFCVIAMAGDQLGDFSNLFNDVRSVPERRGKTGRPAIDRLWGHGWFVFPNPVYGKALKGTPDQIFPADRRWHPTGVE